VFVFFGYTVEGKHFVKLLLIFSFCTFGA